MHRDEQGQSLVEFALSALLLLMLLFGVMDCSRALYVNHYVASAARAGARYAMVRGGRWTPAACGSVTAFACAATANDVRRLVVTTLPAGIDPALLTVRTVWPGTDAAGASCVSGGGGMTAAGCIVEVQVTYRFHFVLPLLPRVTWTIPATSRVTIAQ